jgi:hypothetical protein
LWKLLFNVGGNNLTRRERVSQIVVFSKRRGCFRNNPAVLCGIPLHIGINDHSQITVVFQSACLPRCLRGLPRPVPMVSVFFRGRSQLFRKQKSFRNNHAICAGSLTCLPRSPRRMAWAVFRRSRLLREAKRSRRYRCRSGYKI